MIKITPRAQKTISIVVLLILSLSISVRFYKDYREKQIWKIAGYLASEVQKDIPSADYALSWKSNVPYTIIKITFNKNVDASLGDELLEKCKGILEENKRFIKASLEKETFAGNNREYTGIEIYMK